ncbi:hypothetical protein [Streptomyces sp. NPDC101249]|uniref:hypothetical protein n=1 Tax=Streptomyces sp. NPDC101249 TaxID=3366140 RepID=UPI003812511A
MIRLICRDCDGFASAMIATGTHYRDGSHVTIRVVCPACKGTGRETSTTSARAGR